LSIAVVALMLGRAGAVLAESDARELRARELFGRGEYGKALDLYGKLYAETLHPTYLRNIGRCYQNLGEADKAISSFREYLRKLPASDRQQRAEIEGFIHEMEELKRQRASAPTSATAPPPDVQGPARAAAGPPPAPVFASAPAPQPRPAPFYGRWWFWTGAAVLAAVGVGIALSAGDRAPAHGNLGYVDYRGWKP
jgi:tetratricopeptide (TPR) repeat protein